MKITVAGVGYVGLSLATLLSQDNEVIAYDIDNIKIDLINKRISPIKDKDIETFFKTKKLNLQATSDYKLAFKDSEYIIICTPTNYDEKTNEFDTTSVENVIQKILKTNLSSTIVIKSTVPVGYTDKIKEQYKINSIIFSPEFLREGSALFDNLYPSRIIVGGQSIKGIEFAELLKKASLKKDVEIKIMKSSEAEAVKLFANTYLALRIAFFNELDTFAESKNLDPKSIIDGISSDSRIGNYYNNPSFGYGGYCLPKDTKQLKSNYNNIPENLISAIINSNETRKKYISESILKYNPSVIGIYRLIMKKDSTNFRESAILDIIKEINKKNNNVRIIIYEPLLHINSFNGFEIVNDFNVFKEQSDIILANRIDERIKNNKKVYTRDIYNIN